MNVKLKAVVFDWAGTMVDFGSRAPVIALQKLFAAEGFDVSEAEARADMGLAKRDHIRAMLSRAPLAAGWLERHGRAASEDDVVRLLEAVGPAMQEAARDCATLIPGAADLVAQLRSAGVKIGSCTGYTRPMMADILPLAAAQGYAPDFVVCSGETAEGRPSPLMLWKNLVELGVWPAEACVKVDDAPVGIAEGLAAGCWTIGVAASGNGVGLSAEDLDTLPQHERRQKIAIAREVLLAAGAHAVIDTVADLPALLNSLPIGTSPHV